MEKICKRNDLPIVSLDRVYITNANAYLEVTRVTDPVTGQTRVSSRPANKPLEEQIKSLRKYKKIILTDAGAFDGETLIEVCNQIERFGITIEEIYLGFSSTKANRKINNNRKLTVLNLYHFYEWIELRDLIGIDGRAVETSEKERTFIPYKENLIDWASIPQESESAVSKLCEQYQLKLETMLTEQGYDIRKIGKAIKWQGGK